MYAATPKGVEPYFATYSASFPFVVSLISTNSVACVEFNTSFPVFLSRACSHKKSVKNQSQSKNRKINNIKLVVASKNFAKTLDPKKKALNLIATFVNFRIIKPR